MINPYLLLNQIHFFFAKDPVPGTAIRRKFKVHRGVTFTKGTAVNIRYFASITESKSCVRNKQV